MTLLHLLHALAVGGLITAAATLAAAALRGSRRPSRGVWIVALAATVTAPVWGPRVTVPAADATTTTVSAVVGSQALDAVATPAGSERWLDVLRAPVPALPAVWLALAGLGLALIATGWIRLERRAARWPRATVDGEEVALSPRFGPAVVGLRRPRTVLPRWMLALPRRDLGVVLAHERAHRDAGDGLLLAAGLTLAVLCPWNPWVWLQFRRLRDATEMDCDRRLLAAGIALPTYARVLVSVRLHNAPTGLAVAALVESTSSLERRLENMNAFPWSRPRAALAVLAAAGLAAAACETPAPSAVAPETGSTSTATEVTEIPSAGVVQGREVERELPLDESTAGTVRLRAPSGEPLIIIDGRPTAGAVFDAVSEVSAENIERIEVIKGEAAVVVYGERGAAGVVSITTKDGSGEIEVRGDVLHEIRGDSIRWQPYDEVVVGTLKERPAPGGGR